MAAAAGDVTVIAVEPEEPDAIGPNDEANEQDQGAVQAVPELRKLYVSEPQLASLFVTATVYASAEPATSFCGEGVIVTEGFAWTQGMVVVVDVLVLVVDVEVLVEVDVLVDEVLVLDVDVEVLVDVDDVLVDVEVEVEVLVLVEVDVDVLVDVESPPMHFMP